MGRPVGVTILAILDFLSALGCILGGIMMIAGGGLAASFMSQTQAQGSASGAGFLAGMGALAGVFFLVCAAIYILLGVGLWKLKNWARMITVVLLAIGAVFQVIGLVGVFMHFNIVALTFDVVILGVEVLILWYLLSANVTAAFTSGQARAAGV